MYLVKLPLNVNIVKQDLLHKNSFWKFYEVGISIDADSGLLGMYFDAVVYLSPARHLFWLTLHWPYCDLMKPSHFFSVL